MSSADSAWEYAKRGPNVSARAIPSGYVYDPNTLSDVPLRQPVINADTLNVMVPTPLSVSGPLTNAQLLAAGLGTQATLAAIDSSTSKLKLTIVSGSAASSGNTTAVTPAAGKKLRVSYLAYNPALAVECAWRFGAAGPLFLRNSMPAGGIVAKDFGDMRYLEGEVDEPLVLNLSLAVTVIWNCTYVEV